MSTIGRICKKDDLGGGAGDKDISPEKVQKMLEFIEGERKMNRSVKARPKDKGECWSLPYMALVTAGAAQPCSAGRNQAPYVWGRVIDDFELAPGDIIQVEGRAELTAKDNLVHRFPHAHHSMVVLSVSVAGLSGTEVTVATQSPGQKLLYTTYLLKSKRGKGVLHYYRPQNP
jgi:hypothetical protein